MKLKLDENIGRDLQRAFADAGHDVQTAAGENLSGADDARLFDACCRESRCLVTFDLDFSDPVRFQSTKCGGIIGLRIAGRSSSTMTALLVKQVISALQSMPLSSNLWIVEPGRIRIHQRDDTLSD